MVRRSGDGHAADPACDRSRGLAADGRSRYGRLAATRLSRAARHDPKAGGRDPAAGASQLPDAGRARGDRSRATRGAGGRKRSSRRRGNRVGSVVGIAAHGRPDGIGPCRRRHGGARAPFAGAAGTGRDFRRLGPAGTTGAADDGLVAPRHLPAHTGRGGPRRDPPRGSARARSGRGRSLRVSEQRQPAGTPPGRTRPVGAIGGARRPRQSSSPRGTAGAICCRRSEATSHSGGPTSTGTISCWPRPTSSTRTWPPGPQATARRAPSRRSCSRTVLRSTAPPERRRGCGSSVRHSAS